MEIIANTKDGCLISATKREVEEILKAVSGVEPEKLLIGQKVPAIDYASTIAKIKSLGENYDYKQLLAKVKCFTEIITDLETVVSNASKIEI